jgi:hypothetical protein
MITHVAPRRVTLVSEDGPQSDISIDLSTVLGVDLATDAACRVNLVVRLTNGARVIACTYARMSEAGPDCGRLRVLAGLPAWSSCSGMAEMEAQWLRRRPVVVAKDFISATISLVLAPLRGHGRRSCNAGRSIFNHPIYGQSEEIVAR